MSEFKNVLLRAAKTEEFFFLKKYLTNREKRYIIFANLRST